MISDLNGSLWSRQFLNIANKRTCFALCACAFKSYSFGMHFWLKSYLCFCCVLRKRAFSYEYFVPTSDLKRVQVCDLVTLKTPLPWFVSHYKFGLVLLLDYRNLAFQNVLARLGSYCNRARLNFQAFALRDMKIATLEGSKDELSL